ncbi:MAG: aspartate aminotransferase family protein [Nitrososphaerales archaeon]
MDEASIIAKEERYLAPVFQKYPVAAIKGEGAKIWDANGKEYIDFMGGYGVAIVGHCNPYVVEAVKSQASKLITCHGSLYNDVRADFLEALASISPEGLTKIYLGNSGAEAVECAIKLARKATGRREIIATSGAFHGKTLGALSITWNPKYRSPFEPLLTDVKFVPYGDGQKAHETVSDKTAAIIVEPIQGESGIHPAPEGYLESLRKIANEKGCILIFDEIQSGLARTGKMWAHQHTSAKPDVMCVAKGLGGGFPLSAVIATENVMSAFKPGDHTSTFGGNPLSCAAGLATIRYLRDFDLAKRAETLGKKMMEGLEELRERHKVVREVRGRGLMLALELRFDVKNILLSALKKGVILLYSGKNILRFLPPLVISEEEIEHGLMVLDELLAEEDRSRLQS